MTSYLILQAVLWGCITLCCAFFSFAKPRLVKRGPFDFVPDAPVEWGTTIAWLAFCITMTAWPLLLL